MTRLCKNWLETYVNEYTTITEAPKEFHFWVGVATIAGALRRCVWIDQQTFLWLPNFYIVLVGPAGVVTKSTTLDLGMRLLEGVPDVTFGPPSATWQALTQTLQDAKMTVQWEDEHGRKFEKPASCITIAASELGTFLKPAAEGLIDVLVDLWDGKLSERAWVHKTKTTGDTVIQNPWINIIGCTTPTWIQSNVPEDMIGGGFFSRVLFVYGSKKTDYIPYPSLVRRPEDYERLRSRLVSDLMEIGTMRGPFTLTPEAYAWGSDWYFKHWGSVATHMVSTRYEGYRARKQTHIHKLAMVLSAAESNNRIVDVQHLMTAERWLASAEVSMNLVYESVGVVDEAKRIKEIAGLLRNFEKQCPQGMTGTEIFRMMQNTMNRADFLEAIKAGVEAQVFLRVGGLLDPKTGHIMQGIRLNETTT
jgi:hypothetical protein